MTARTINSTMDTLFILDAISYRNKVGMTVGEIAKTQGELSRGQVQRILDNLVGSGFVWAETVPHGRTGKRMYRVGDNCAMICASIARRVCGGGE